MNYIIYCWTETYLFSWYHWNSHWAAATVSLEKSNTFLVISLKCSWNKTLFPLVLINSTQTLSSSTFKILTQISVFWVKSSYPVVSKANLILYFSAFMVGSIFSFPLKCSIRASSIKSGLHVEKNSVFYANTFSYWRSVFWGIDRASSLIFASSYWPLALTAAFVFLVLFLLSFSLFFSSLSDSILALTLCYLYANSAWTYSFVIVSPYIHWWAITSVIDGLCDGSS